jgi:hypothetical protein
MEFGHDFIRRRVQQYELDSKAGNCVAELLKNAEVAKICMNI